VGGLGRRLAPLGDRQTKVVELASPGVALFVQIGVREHIVQEDVVRDVLAPRHLAPGPVREFDVGNEKIGLQGGEVAVGHVGYEERHPDPAVAGNGLQRPLQLRTIILGPCQGLLDVGGPGLGRRLGEGRA
jgi:hypothetical protein